MNSPFFPNRMAKLSEDNNIDLLLENNNQIRHKIEDVLKKIKKHDDNFLERM